MVRDPVARDDGIHCKPRHPPLSLQRQSHPSLPTTRTDLGTCPREWRNMGRMSTPAASRSRQMNLRPLCPFPHISHPPAHPPPFPYAASAEIAGSTVLPNHTACAPSCDMTTSEFVALPPRASRTRDALTSVSSAGYASTSMTTSTHAMPTHPIIPSSRVCTVRQTRILV
jgi:hypothetical protein